MEKMKTKKKRSDTFNEKEELLKLQGDLDKEKHERWMEGLKYQRDSEKIHHEHEMERQRIKSAEIKRMQERKELMRLRN